MNSSYLDILPPDLTKFIIVALYALIIGLSQRKMYLKKEEIPYFGSDRTFTLIGILGYVLYVLSPESMGVFLAGGGCLTVFLALNYAYKMFYIKHTGLTSIIIALITYCLAPIVYTKDLWVSILVVVSVLILTEMKSMFINFTKKINDLEFINLAKFFIISGVILPVLPKTEIIEGVSLTPYNIWLSTVVISGISYVSYLLKKYVFKDAGIIVTGILGGVYSSTATCIILAKKAREAKDNQSQYVAAIYCAIAMMYVKFMILMGIFNFELLCKYWSIFVVMALFTGAIAMFFYYKLRKGAGKGDKIEEEEDDKNPLEFKVALIFASLFIAFTLITHYTLVYFGDNGLRTLSILVGVSDINPFLINLFQSQYDVTESLLVMSAFQAIISNNVVKMIYGIFFSNKVLLKPLIVGFSLIFVVNIFLLFIIL